MKKKIISSLFIILITFIFTASANAEVYFISDKTNKPLSLYDINNLRYDYNSENYFDELGFPLPSYATFYDSKKHTGNTYNSAQVTQTTYLNSTEKWENLGLQLTILVENPIQDNYEFSETEKLPLYRQNLHILAESERLYVKQAVGNMGAEKLFDFLEKYCRKNNFKYQKSSYNNTLYFYYTTDKNAEERIKNKRHKEDEKTEKRNKIPTSFSYTFDYNENKCEISVSAPSVNLFESLNISFAEPETVSMADFGLDLTKDSRNLNGYMGFFVKNVKPYSHADRCGFMKSDHIIKINNRCISDKDTLNDITKELNEHLHRNKEKITVYVLSSGIIKEISFGMSNK